MNIIVICVLLAMILYQGVINWIDRRDARTRERDLLNRILAKSFPEYVDGSKRLERKPDKPLTAEERTEGIRLASKFDHDVLEVT